MKDNKNGQFKNIVLWMAIALLVMAILSHTTRNTQQVAPQWDYSEFMEKVQAGQVKRVTIEGKNNITAVSADGAKVSVYAPQDAWLVSDLLKNKVQIKAKEEEQPGLLMTILVSWAPTLLLIGAWIWFMRAQTGAGKGGNNPFSFGKSRARMMDDKQNTVTFVDVAGCDEAKHEVEEIVDFLRDPSKFQKLGGRIPKGVLMVGPPGTGKTLLAKAIAGEAKVPFFTISGSDFVEMFVGVGAARVRDMFAEAKKNAPCIIFIDEIDAVGRQRGAGLGGGNDEREQTLNQMLVEMDGFEASSGIIIIGATNRPDVLDPALMRPGRLDRQVVVGLPDMRGREKILGVHVRKVPVCSKVALKTIARGTPGFSGADLANLVNEAALFAARSNKKFVEMDDFEKAKDKIIMGAERKSVLMPESERQNTAYHESGHAVVACVLPGTDPVHKVTIIPRGRALGVTMQLPEQDRYSHDRESLLNNIAILFGGRIAEEVFMKQATTGASNDFERATGLARKMVMQWGMSSLGPMVMAEEEGEVFLGRSIASHKGLSETTMREAELEVKKILNEQYERARTILLENREKVEAMTKALMEIETIDAEQISDIMAGREIRGYEEKYVEAEERRNRLIAEQEGKEETPTSPDAGADGGVPPEATAA